MRLTRWRCADRDRHVTAGARSDSGDAKVLADLVRTDRMTIDRLPVAVTLGEAVKVLAWGHRSLIWARNRHTNMLRSALCEYYPIWSEACDALHHCDALAALKRAPTLAAVRWLTRSRIKTAPKLGGWRRNIDGRAGIRESSTLTVLARRLSRPAPNSWNSWSSPW